MGVERLVALMQAAGGAVPAPPPDVYVVVSGPQAAAQALDSWSALRGERPGVRFELNLGGGKLQGAIPPRPTRAARRWR